MSHIFRRMSDVITANINAIIETAEDPEIMIQQIIREMENHICKGKKSLLKALTVEKRIEIEIRFHKSRSEMWYQRAESSLKNGDEDLARNALDRKTDHDRTLEELSENLYSAKKTNEKIKRQLKQMCKKLAALKREAATLKARQHSARARVNMMTILNSFEHMECPDQKFERMASKIVDMEAEAAACEDFAEDGPDFERLEKDQLIDEQMLDLKMKLTLSK